MRGTSWEGTSAWKDDLQTRWPEGGVWVIAPEYDPRQLEELQTLTGASIPSWVTFFVEHWPERGAGQLVEEVPLLVNPELSAPPFESFSENLKRMYPRYVKKIKLCRQLALLFVPPGVRGIFRPCGPEWVIMMEPSEKEEGYYFQDYWCAAPPATLNEILATEKALGYSLPPSFRSFLLLNNGIRNGLLDPGIFRAGTSNRTYDHTLIGWYAGWLEMWREFEKVRWHGASPQIRPDVECAISRYKRFLPFFTDGCGNDMCFDLSQRDENGECPVVEWDHETSTFVSVADSFCKWFEHVIASGIPSPRFA